MDLSRRGAVITLLVSPWLGIGARLVTADPAKLVGVGVLFFIGTALWILYWMRFLRVKFPEHATARIFIFTVQFITFYTLTVLLTSAVLHQIGHVRQRDYMSK